MYVYGYGDRSIAVYSFDTDILCEVNIIVNPSDKLFFDIGVKRVLVVANYQLGEFTVVYLPA